MVSPENVLNMSIRKKITTKKTNDRFWEFTKYCATSLSDSKTYAKLTMYVLMVKIN